MEASRASRLIEFERVVAGYSPTLTILNELSLDARRGEITLLIGPNGAGKSTALKALFGLLTPRTGEIRLHNLELGGITLPGKALRRERVEEILELFPSIRERLGNQASTLSGGEQKQLEIGRALLLKPRVLLIDEPSIGLSPKISQEVFQLLRRLADTGTTLLMVEQNVRSALKYADRALVLEMGRLALDRPAGDLLEDPNLNRLFLGGAAVQA